MDLSQFVIYSAPFFPLQWVWCSQFKLPRAGALVEVVTATAKRIRANKGNSSRWFGSRSSIHRHHSASSNLWAFLLGKRSGKSFVVGSSEVDWHGCGNSIATCSQSREQSERRKVPLFDRRVGVSGKLRPGFFCRHFLINISIPSRSTKTV